MQKSIIVLTTAIGIDLLFTVFAQGRNEASPVHGAQQLASIAAPSRTGDALRYLRALIGGHSVRTGTTRLKASGIRIAAGDECPATSGVYCSDDFPVCCLVNNEYQCYAKLSDCTE